MFFAPIHKGGNHFGKAKNDKENTNSKTDNLKLHEPAQMIVCRGQMLSVQIIKKLYEKPLMRIKIL